jgi:hypothetical protein
MSIWRYAKLFNIFLRECCLQEGTMNSIPVGKTGNLGLQGHSSHVMVVEKLFGENFSLLR